MRRLYRSELQFSLRNVERDVEHGQETLLPSGTTAFQKAIETCAGITAVCVCLPLFQRVLFWARIQEGRGRTQPIQSCTNEDTGCALVELIQDAGSTYLRVTPLHFLCAFCCFHGGSHAISLNLPRSCAAAEPPPRSAVTQKLVFNRFT